MTSSDIVGKSTRSLCLRKRVGGDNFRGKISGDLFPSSPWQSQFQVQQAQESSTLFFSEGDLH